MTSSFSYSFEAIRELAELYRDNSGCPHRRISTVVEIAIHSEHGIKEWRGAEARTVIAVLGFVEKIQWVYQGHCKFWWITISNPTTTEGTDGVISYELENIVREVLGMDLIDNPYELFEPDFTIEVFPE